MSDKVKCLEMKVFRAKETGGIFNIILASLGSDFMGKSYSATMSYTRDEGKNWVICTQLVARNMELEVLPFYSNLKKEMARAIRQGAVEELK